jgi:hypothetical protein
VFTFGFTLRSRIAEATKNLTAGVDAVVGKNAAAAKGICVARTPRSQNNEPGHVHTQDTIRVERVESGHYKIVAGGAMLFIELGTMYRAPLAPMRTSIEAIKPEMLRDLRQIKVL